MAFRNTSKNPTINIYGLPRSGTNFLANWLFMNYRVNAINSGGGRYPLRTDPQRYSIYLPSGMYRRECSAIVRDEMSFTLRGGRRNFLKHLASRFLVTSAGNYNFVLLRDPIATSISMHNYFMRYQTHAHWNMEKDENILSFLNEYVSLVDPVNQRKFNVIGSLKLQDVISGRHNGFFDALLERCSPHDLWCGKGHEIKRVGEGFECQCGPVIAQGGTKTSTRFDLERYISPIESYDTSRIKNMLVDIYEKGDPP